MHRTFGNQPSATHSVMSVQNIRLSELIQIQRVLQISGTSSAIKCNNFLCVLTFPAGLSGHSSRVQTKSFAENVQGCLYKKAHLLERFGTLEHSMPLRSFLCWTSAIELTEVRSLITSRSCCNSFINYKNQKLAVAVHILWNVLGSSTPLQQG